MKQQPHLALHPYVFATLYPLARIKKELISRFEDDIFSGLGWARDVKWGCVFGRGKKGRWRRARVRRERGVFGSERVGPIAGAAGCICAPRRLPGAFPAKMHRMHITLAMLLLLYRPAHQHHASACTALQRGLLGRDQFSHQPLHACARVEGWGWQHCARVQWGWMMKGWEGGWMHPGSHCYASATMHACIYKGGLTFDPLTLLLYHSLAAYFT